MNEPIVTKLKLESGSKLVRFSDIQDAYWYDNPENNPFGISIRGLRQRSSSDRRQLDQYFKERSILTQEKIDIMNKAKSEFQRDPEFLKLVYKGKSLKRKFEINKFVGNLSIVDYAKGADKIFKKSVPGAKKQTLNMAFQVGTFVGGNYVDAFTRILKTIMMCQAMNINVNIDVFDSDVSGIDGGLGYCIINVAKSSEKINFIKILTASHEEFFRYTLFNGYSAYGDPRDTHINGFIGTNRITKDLGPMYDVIGGNLLNNESNEMLSKILKIGIHE